MYPDSYLVLPKHALGKNYVLYSYALKPEAKADTAAEAGMIATEDGTSVTVTVGDLGGSASTKVYDDLGNGYRSGETINFNLNRMETYHIKCEFDITGWLVTSSKPLAVVAGNKDAYVTISESYNDHLVEMIPPNEQFGRHFVLAATTRAGGDIVRVISPQASTSVTFPSTGRSTISLGQGEFTQITLAPTDVVVAIADKPVMFVQFNKGGASDTSDLLDPFSVYLAPLEQMLYRYDVCEQQVSGIGMDFDVHRVTVSLPANKVSGLRVDGALVSPTYTTSSGMAGGVRYSAALVSTLMDLTSTRQTRGLH